MLNKLELKEGVGVFTVEGKQVGKINRFVLDPVTKEITHIVVQKGWLFPEDKVIPIHTVNYSTDDKVVVSDEIGDFKELPSFEEEHFLRLTEDDIDRSEYPNYTAFPAYYPYPPVGHEGYPATTLGTGVWPPVETTRNIPDNTVALKEGANVISSDGENVGVVERLFVDPDTNKVTHFGVAHGLLTKERKNIPVQWISSVQENEVHIVISSKLLNRVQNHEE
jgi:uncharacterized protein YrrD